jgi:hypothetical protein
VNYFRKLSANGDKTAVGSPLQSCPALGAPVSVEVIFPQEDTVHVAVVEQAGPDRQRFQFRQ